MVFTYDDGGDGKGGHCNVRKVIADWVSDASAGTASGASRKIVGRLVKCVTDPGSPAPSDNYDINITDEQGIDVLAACQSALADRDTANSEEVYFLVKDTAGTPLAQSIHPVVCNALTVSITNAGNSKTGQIILYYEPI